MFSGLFVAPGIGAAVLKIQRSANGKVVFRLSGRIDAEDVPELRRLFGLENVGRRVALDLEDVTLVDSEGVAFLVRCEIEGIKLENCPFYVRKWLEEEQGRKPGRKRSARAKGRDDSR